MSPQYGTDNIPEILFDKLIKSLITLGSMGMGIREWEVVKLFSEWE
jgi:hypothetical protein